MGSEGGGVGRERREWVEKGGSGKMHGSPSTGSAHVCLL